MERAVIYARYSSDQQREESIDAQVRACREYCQRKGYLVTKIYADEAKSGKSIAKREQYKKMLSDSQKNLFDVVVFHKIDRNSRNELDYYLTKNQLISSGIKYEYAAQNIDTSPAGQMVEGILVAVAANYSRNLAEETKKGLKENALKALFNGGRPPLGFEINQENKYIINDYEAGAIRIIFDLYLKGKGYHYIISQLNSLGYKTREGRKFGKNSLYDILRNPKYCGTYTFNKVNKDPSGKRNSHKISENTIIVEDAIPAIISKEDFRKVQEKMSRNKHRTAAYRSKETYLLTGKAFCGICGAAMTGHRASARGKKYVYYTCAARDRLGISACENKVVPRDELEQVVLDTLKEELLSNNFQKNLNHYILEEFHTLASEVSNEADSLAEQKAIAERKLNNLYSIIEQGTADEYDLQRLADVKRELTSIKEKLSKCAAAHSLSDINPRAIERTIKLCRNMLLKNASAETLTLIFDDMVEKIVIGAKKITLQFKLECFDTYGAEGPYNTIPQKFTLTFIRPRPLTVRQQQAQKKLNPANI